MTVQQLSPSIPLVTPRGPGEAVAMIFLSQEHNLQWVVIQDETGELWTWDNQYVRAFPVWSIGRMPGVKVQQIVEDLKQKYSALTAAPSYGTKKSSND